MPWSHQLLLGVTWICSLPTLAQPSSPPYQTQNSTFNSNFRLSAAQIALANLSSTAASNVEVAINFERSNWANGSVETEDFYRVPRNASDAAPGTLLKLEVDANTSAYTLPPNTALSRILFQTEDLNGTALPASAFILWPYLPRTQPDGGFPVVAWAHGTSGATGDCAPSHIRNLWYQFTAPYPLVLDGYVVVAPDFLGLGVNRDAQGNPIAHPYIVNPSHANDLVYSVQAAQAAFTVLSKHFVVVGHSQGGGAAWGVAQRQAQRHVEGYLGAVAGSPVTSVGRLLTASAQLAGVENTASIAVFGAISAATVFPSFNVSMILTPLGLRRLALYSEIKGCDSVRPVLFSDPGLVQPDWYEGPYLQAFDRLASNGGKPIGGPLLVLQGTADMTVFFPVTTAGVNETCVLYPDSQLQYMTFAGVDHVPVMYASQRLWLKWIADRFAGVELPRGCQQSNITAARQYQYYQKESNWFLEFAIQPYETA